MYDFKDQAALVVGGTGGIGRAVVRGLLAGGARVAIGYRQAAGRARELVAEAAGQGRQALPVQVDIARPEDSRRAVAATVEAFGGLDILVNTAGWHTMRPFHEETPENIEATIDVEFRGTVYLAQAALPHLRARRGRVVFVGSDSGKVGNTGMAVSAGCRGAVNAFAKSLARESARHGLLVNVVAPGPTDDELWQQVKGQSEWAARITAAMERAIPIRRLPRPEEVAAVVLFLASRDNGVMTGQVVSASGGLTMC